MVLGYGLSIMASVNSRGDLRVNSRGNSRVVILRLYALELQL